jgi:hypothetical protein
MPLVVHVVLERLREWGIHRTHGYAGDGTNTLLGAKLAQAEKSAPTRPHADTPANPGVLKTVGAAAAAMDHVRDAITGRGRQ